MSSHCESATVDSEVDRICLTLLALEVRSGGVMILCPSRTQLLLPFNVVNLRMALPGLSDSPPPRAERLSDDSDFKRFSLSACSETMRGLLPGSASPRPLASIQVCS